MYLVSDFYTKYKEELDLVLVSKTFCLNRKIKKPEVHRPGLSLTGYLKNFSSGRVIVFGKVEVDYLKELQGKVKRSRLEQILSEKTPVVIVAHRHRPPSELVEICEKKKIPLFRSSLSTMTMISTLTLLLVEEFSPQMTLHATLVEVFGIGVLIRGDSAVGKSEAALGLIERGHRLITDDVVKIKKTKEQSLIGCGPDLTRHMMEIRGVGIINVAHLYGAVCVRSDKRIDIVVKLEPWDDQQYYDRIGTNKNCDILGIHVPFHTLPVKPGRDVVLLIETISLNERLKGMGYNSAQEFNKKLLQAIEEKKYMRNG
jgi:HPr kinase/phosphorylase